MPLIERCKNSLRLQDGQRLVRRQFGRLRQNVLEETPQVLRALLSVAGHAYWERSDSASAHSPRSAKISGA